MTYSTTDTYKMKRSIVKFSEKISAPLAKPERKFFTDMVYCLLASGSCLLSKIAHELHEDTKKIKEEGTVLPLADSERNTDDLVIRDQRREGLVQAEAHGQKQIAYQTARIGGTIEYDNPVCGGVGLLRPFLPMHTPKRRLAMLFGAIIAF